MEGFIFILLCLLALLPSIMMFKMSNDDAKKQEEFFKRINDPLYARTDRILKYWKDRLEKTVD